MGVIASKVPHSPQYFLSSGFGDLHLGQSTIHHAAIKFVKSLPVVIDPNLQPTVKL
jgi:hypothetical protein